MFKNVTFLIYGRAVCGKDWPVLNPHGVNRLYYIHSGYVYYIADNKKILLKEGRLYFFPQNLPFRLQMDDNVLIDHTYFDFFTFPIIKMDNILEICPEKHPIISAAAQITTRLADTWPMAGAYKQNSHSELIKSYFNNLFSLIHEEMPINQISDTRILPALEYIQNNYSTELSVTELARICNLETNFFIKRFKYCVGITPHKYIVNYRMNSIVPLLRDGKYTIAQLAEHIGYSDTAAFSNAFRKMYGCYPKEYAKKLKEHTK